MDKSETPAAYRGAGVFIVHLASKSWIEFFEMHYRAVWIFLTGFAGTPATIVFSSTSLVTTAPAETIAPSMVIGGRSVLVAGMISSVRSAMIDRIDLRLFYQAP